MKLILSILFSLTVFIARSQSREIWGHVTDDKRNPLSSVTVSANDSLGNIIQYNLTDDEGRFLLKLDTCIMSRIIFSSIGYKTVVIYSKDLVPDMKIILSEEEFTIPEVVIASSPIRAHGDTVSYSINSFISEKDHSVSDVLKKMPGIEVFSDGSIQYMGKNISTVYVEGLDLTGGRYAQITENLSAEKVRSVQVYENHQRIKSLRNISFSDQAALNLTLKDGAKGTTEWILEAAAGHFLHTEENTFNGSTRLMQMRFNKTFQQMNLYKNDFLGEDVSSEIRFFNDDGYGIENTMLSSVFTPVQGISRERYSFNKSHLVSTNTLWQTKGGGSSRLQGSFFTDNIRTTQSVMTDYFLDNSLIRICEQNESSQRHSEISVEHQYIEDDYSSHLENYIQFYGDFDHETAMSYRNGKDSQQDVSPRQYYIRDKFDAVKVTEDGKYLLKGAITFNHLPGKLLIVDDVTQRLSQDVLRGKVDFTYSHPYYNTNINWSAGIDGAAGLYSVCLDSKEKRSGSFNRLITYASCGVSYKKKKVRFSATLPLSILSRSYGDSCAGIKFFIRPVVYCDWQLIKNLRTVFTTRYTFIPDDFRSVWKEKLFTTYTNFSVGSDKMTDEEGISGVFSLQYRNALQGLFCNLSVSYMEKFKQTLISHTVTEDNLVSYCPSELSGKGRTGKTGASISKSIPFCNLNISVKGRYSFGKSQYISENQICDSRFTGYSAGGDISLTPADWLILDIKGQYSVQERNYQKEEVIRTSLYEGTYKMFYIIEKWMLEVSGSQFCNRQPERSNLFFLDSSVSYRKKNFEIGLYVKNLTGITSFVRRTFSDYSSTRTETVIRPREIYFKITYDL